MKILISACLLGENCKYNGGNNLSSKLQDYLEKNKDAEIIKFCPEVLSGFPIPREPIEYVDGKLIDQYGNDYNLQLEQGKNIIAKLLEENQFDLAILKAKSPSCGVNGIYDGTFTRHIVMKDGFAVEIIKKKGIQVLSELDL